MIIFLNGTSSCGKTSIAKEILKLSREKFVHMETDNLIDENPILETKNGIDVCCHRPVLKRLDDIVNSDNNVVLDGMLLSNWSILSYKETFLKTKTYFIKVEAPLDVCKSREKVRQDRCIGTAELFFKIAHNYISEYDLAVDTNIYSPTENAIKILEFIDTCQDPQARDNNLLQLATESHTKQIAYNLS